MGLKVPVPLGVTPPLKGLSPPNFKKAQPTENIPLLNYLAP